jgi:Transposase DDE domain
MPIQSPIQGTCIRAWQEEDASAEPLEWILFTTLPIADAQAALRHLQWYSHRWLIEEYHKCLKSGCALEKRQLATADGLERLLGFLAIVAVKLLQVRTLGQQNQCCSTDVPMLL